MNDNTPEIIGRALIIGTLAIIATSSAPALAVVTSVVAVFCIGRAMQMRRKP